MIDFHSHILPQTDDGPFDSASSLEIARILASAGFTEVYCTPHMMKGAYETEPAEVRKRVIILQEMLEENFISLKLSPGAEYYLDEYLPVFLDDPHLAASGFILAEAPVKACLQVIEGLADTILSRGIKPLIAHPERSLLFSATKFSNDKRSLFSPVKKFFGRGETAPETYINPAIATFLSKGCLLQGNIGSFAGVYGKNVRNCALDLLEKGLYSCLGSDAHRPEYLEDILHKGLATIRDRIGIAETDRLLSGELLPNNAL